MKIAPFNLPKALLMLQMLLLSAPLFCQESTLTPKTKDTLIHTISQKLSEHYVFKDKGEAMGLRLTQAHKDGMFDTIRDFQRFATAVQSFLRTFCNNDKHLRLMYFPPKIEALPKTAKKDLSPLEREFEKRKGQNFGIPEIKLLSNNIGYLKLSKLTSPQLIGPVVKASSIFLQHVDGLILDLRPRGGGSSYTMELLLSYFLPEAVHIYTWEFRDPNMLEQSWTLPYVAGHRFLDIPIVVLTSKDTFSGSEAISYALKHHKRATLIGETTAGGAHTYKEFSLSKEYLLLVPYGRMLSTQTNSNWETTGVIPDIAISADKALNKAIEVLSGNRNKSPN